MRAYLFHRGVKLLPSEHFGSEDATGLYVGKDGDHRCHHAEGRLRDNVAVVGGERGGRRPVGR